MDDLLNLYNQTCADRDIDVILVEFDEHQYYARELSLEHERHIVFGEDHQAWGMRITGYVEVENFPSGNMIIFDPATFNIKTKDLDIINAKIIWISTFNDITEINFEADGSNVIRYG
jgi:hypothetical protein